MRNFSNKIIIYEKAIFLLGAVTIFAACNNSGSNENTGKDITATTTSTTTTIKKGRMIANFASRSFMDIKTNHPIKLVWDTVHYYYIDESTGKEPGFYYDPAAHDTFDYWGRVVNNALNYSNNDYSIDETRLPADENMSNINSNVSMDTSTANDIQTTTTTTTADSSSKMANGKMKTKIKDDKMKEKVKSK